MIGADSSFSSGEGGNADVDVVALDSARSEQPSKRVGGGGGTETSAVFGWSGRVRIRPASPLSFGEIGGGTTTGCPWDVVSDGGSEEICVPPWSVRGLYWRER